MKDLCGSLRLVFLASLPLSLGIPAFALDSEWTSGGLDPLWTNGANWSAGAPGSTTLVTGSATGNTDTATFDRYADSAVTVDAYRNINYITFSLVAGVHTLQTGTLALSDSGAITINGGVRNPQHIATSVLFVPAAATAAFANNSSHPGVVLDIAGAVTGQRPAASIGALSLNGVGAGAISGAIGNGSGGGKISLVKNGANTWTLSGANTFSGGITANNGNLVLDYASQPSLAAASTPVTLGGGTLTLKGAPFGATAQTLGALTLAASKGLGTIVVDKNGGAGTTLTIDNSWTRNAGANMLFDLSSGGSIVSTPGVTDGVVTGASGTAAGFLVRDTTGKTDFAARGTGNSIVRLDTVANAVTTYATGSPVAVSTKNYKITGDTALTAGTNTFGTLRIDASTAPVTVSMGAKNLLFGKSVMIVDGSQDVLLASDEGTGGGKLGSVGFILENFNTATTTIAARIGITTGGNTSGSFAGPGLTVLNFDNSTQDGGTSIQGSILRLANTKALPNGVLSIQNGGVLELGAADFTRAPGNGLSAVQFNSGNGGFSAFGAPRIVNLGGSGGTVTWASGSFLADGATFILGSRVSDNTLTFANAINLNDGNRVVQVNDGTSSTDIDAVLGGILSSTTPSAGSLTKTGPGALALTASNTYAGGTNILGGQLHIGIGGATGALSDSGTLYNAGALVFNRSNTYTYAGLITGPGGVKQIGAGKTVLASLGGLNDYTGPTTVSAGTLAGGGSSGSALTVGNATLAPGVLTGTFHAASATLSANSTLSIEIDGSSADKLEAGGAVHLAGSLDIVRRNGGFTEASYVIVQGASITGAFTNITAGYKVVYTPTQVIVSTAPTYATWAAQWAPGQTASQDHDNDGVPNGVEYFMGATGSTPTIPPGVVEHDGVFSVTWPKGATYFGLYGVDYLAQTSTNLQPEGQPGGWADAPAGDVIDTAEFVSVALPAGQPRAFARLKIFVRDVPVILPDPPTAIPPVPQGLAMTANSETSITLTWYQSPVNNNAASLYHVFASSTSTGTFTEIGTTATRSFTHAGLSANTTRYYKISAANVVGESARTAYASGFTIIPTAGADLPVLIAKNMCVSLNATIISTVAPNAGTLARLVDGLDSTSCSISGTSTVKIKLNASVPIDDAEYLMLNFRSDTTGQSYAYNINWLSLKDYVISQSTDSTNGTDGTWTDVVTGTNSYLDGVIVIPTPNGSPKPKWIGIRNSGSMKLCRLQLFRSAPAGYRNDYWIFAGDSLIVQDMVGGAADVHSVWFSDLVRQRHPDRYPIMVNSSQGGEVMANTYSRMVSGLPVYAAANGSSVPTGTFLCWEIGFNDVGVASGLWKGADFIAGLTKIQTLCDNYGMFVVPARIEFSTGYLNPDTLEPTNKTDNVFYNTLAVNLAGVDVYTRKFAPYACDPLTQLPYADYWSYTRNNYATALGADGVHHSRVGTDGINTLWADVAEKMVYAKQP